MNNYEFFDDILNNINLFFSILIFSFILHYFLFRNQVKSFFDPYFIAVFSSVFCFTDVFFMYFVNKISFYVLSSYILTQISFILGFFTFKKLKAPIIETQVLKTKKDVYRKNLIAFYFFSFIYIITQVIIYSTKGIPLYMVSRLETFIDGSGSGVLGRITEVSSVFSLYSFLLVTKFNKFTFNETVKYITIILIFLTFILSGSKASFLIVFYVLWAYILFSQIKGSDYLLYLKILKAHTKKLILVSIFLASLVIYIQSKNISQDSDVKESFNPLVEMAFRFVYSGDIYWFSYPNNVYQSIPNNNATTALFGDIFGLFRIYSWTEMPEALGLTMKRYHHPSDVITGSNARHNVFGLIYFGFIGSIIFSFILGLFLSFIRNKLPYYLNNTFFGGGVFTYLIIKTAGLDTDPPLAVTYLDNLFFIFPILYIFYLLLVEFMNFKNNEKNI
jgi:oligosaccharide repeat unit polymerase